MLIRSRIVSLLIITVVIVTAVIPTFAEVVYPNGISGNTLIVNITQSNGQVKGSATARVKQNCTAKVTIIVQKNVNDKWVSVACANGGREVGVTCTMTSGYEYRMYGTLTVYDASGKEVDRISKYSQVRKY